MSCPCIPAASLRKPSRRAKLQRLELVIWVEINLPPSNGRAENRASGQARGKKGNQVVL